MSPRGLHLEHIATTPSERIANVLRAHASEDSDTADSVRWMGRNLQHARAALAELDDAHCYEAKPGLMCSTECAAECACMCGREEETPFDWQVMEFCALGAVGFGARYAR